MSCCPKLERRREIPLFGIHPNIAEFWTTLSNLAFALVGVARLLLNTCGCSVFVSNDVHVLYLLLVLAAICSAYHHARDVKWTLLVDWIPITLSLVLVASIGTRTVSYTTCVVACMALSWLVIDHVRPITRPPIGHGVWHILAALAADAMYQDLNQARVVTGEADTFLNVQSDIWSVCLLAASFFFVCGALWLEHVAARGRRERCVLAATTTTTHADHLAHKTGETFEILPGRLYITARISAMDHAMLERCKIEHVLSLLPTASINGDTLPSNIKCSNWSENTFVVSVPDDGATRAFRIGKLCDRFSALMCETDGAVLVCDAGKSSPSVCLVLSYLLRLREKKHREKISFQRNTIKKADRYSLASNQQPKSDILRGLWTHVQTLTACVCPDSDCMIMLENLQYSLDHGARVFPLVA
jgi:predicted outer membrane lipoprotein